MAKTEIRGKDQIKNQTVGIEDIVLDWTEGSDWDITNGAADATLTGLAVGVNATDAVNKSQLDALEAQLESSVVLRGGLTAPADMTGTATGNTYIDAGNGYSKGDKFLIGGTGDLTVSDGVIAVNSGDSITLVNDVASNALVTVADVWKTDNTESADILRTGDVVDNLTSTDVDAPLSANQGRVLDVRVTALETAQFSFAKENLATTHNSPNLPALANTPIAGSEDVFLNGLLMEVGSGNDYTIVGSTIVMEYNMKNNDKVIVKYRF